MFDRVTARKSDHKTDDQHDNCGSDQCAGRHTSDACSETRVRFGHCDSSRSESAGGRGTTDSLKQWRPVYRARVSETHRAMERRDAREIPCPSVSDSRTRTVFAVSGMHRSGTSFVASVLPALGVSLGDTKRLMRPGPDNPAGYYEVQSILECNEELLAHLGGAWDAPPVLDPGWEDDRALDSFRTRAHEIVDETFGADASQAARIAFKDPRLSLLLPFWRTVVPIASTIVLVRDPREVAASLGARKYAVQAPRAAGLWLRYLLAAVANDPGHLLIRHSDLFDAFSDTLRRIATHVGAAPPDAAIEAEVRELLQPELRHYRSTPSEDSLRPDPLTALADAVWNNGIVNLNYLPPVVADAIERGWLSGAADSDVLAQARADVIAARETLRRRNRELAELTKQPTIPLTQQQPS